MPARGGPFVGTGGSAQDSAVLPVTYRRHVTVDLKNDKRLAFAVQGIFVLAGLIAVGVALLFGLPLETQWPPILTIPVTVVACLVYMAVHEATHGVALQLITGMKASYSMRFPFLTTGTDAYLTRRSTVVVALMPGVLWGTLLLLALLTVPADFRLSAYIVLTLNFAGSAGDIVEVFVVTRQQRDALIQDDGKSVHVFLPRQSSSTTALTAAVDEN